MMDYEVATVVFLCGVILIWRGWRGRRLDDHPICRKCRYDLFGLPTLPAQCTECGGLLRGRRDIRIGNRRRMPYAAVAGLLLLLGSASFLTVRVATIHRDFDWNTIKPVWWLRDEATSQSWTKSAAAINELLRRARAGSLDAADIDGLIDLALEVHADPTARWHAAWGEVMRYAYDESAQLSQGQWQTFLRNLPGFALNVTPTARSGGLLTFEVARNPRAWKDPNWPPREFIPVMVVESVTIDGQSIALADFIDGAWKRRDNSGFPWAQHVAPIAVSPGKHKIEVRIHGSVIVRQATSALPSLQPIPPALQWTETLIGEVDVLPPDQSLLALRDDAKLRQEVQNSFAIHSIRGESYSDHHLAHTIVGVNDAPANLFHRIYARVGDREWQISGIQCRQGDSKTFRTGASLLDGFPIGIDSVDLVFRPDLDRAETFFSRGADFFAGEVVIQDVPIIWETSKPEGDNQSTHE